MSKQIPCNHCGRVKIGQQWSRDQCRYCWLFHHNEKYRLLWGGELPVAEVVGKREVRPVLAEPKRGCNCR